MNDPPATNELHEATDRLNQALGRLERKLRDMNLGVEASIPMGAGVSAERLAFVKTSKGFVLVVDFPSYPGEPGGGEVPLCNCSREIRLQAVSQLPELRAALRAAYEQEKARVNTAIRAVDRLADNLAGTDDP